MTHIQKLKAQLEKFDIKDLREGDKILGMEISRDKSTSRFWLSQEKYVLKMLEKFNMAEVRPVTTPLAGHFRLSSTLYPNSQEKKIEISRVPYAIPAGSLVYAMIYTRPDLAYALSTVSRFMSNPDKTHWETVK